jgi:tripartite-type tricarboxylate transporter receptor subunit TctC
MFLTAQAATPQAIAQNWPSRPIKLIVPTGPGAATDIMARLIADDVSRARRPRRLHVSVYKHVGHGHQPHFIQATAL